MIYVSFFISTFALFIISITMLARANDLRWRPGMKWNARLLGFILAGCAPIGIVGYEWAKADWPSLYEAVFRVGLMLVFVTTPYLPPWWKWISGKDDRLPHWADDRRKPE
jgi:hypothetical protein